MPHPDVVKRKGKKISFVQLLLWSVLGRVKCPVCHGARGWYVRRKQWGNCPTCEGRGYVKKVR